MNMVTLQDIARAAGVSVATASWAINDDPKARIPQATRDRVRRVASELGYRRNALARGLARGHSDLIGFISDGVATSPFAGQVIRGAQDEAWRQGKILLVVDTGGDRKIEERAFEFMLERRVEGLVYSSWVHRRVDAPAGLAGVNAVLVNCYDRLGRLPAVVPDEVGGGLSATRLLLQAGHRRIAFINASARTPASVGRLKGYRQALSEAGVAYDPSLVIREKEADQESGYRAMREVMATGATAVFCHNDRTAMGFYDALRECGQRVPDDISVVGFDNQEVISAHLHPALTTVGLPQYDLGRLGIRALMARGDDSTNHPAAGSGGLEPQLVPCPLVVRDSIARI